MAEEDEDKKDVEDLIKKEIIEESLDNMDEKDMIMLYALSQND